jgi:hypothetical protein
MALSKAEKKKLARLNAERAGRGEPPIVRIQPKSRFAQAIAISKPAESNVSQMRRRREVHPIDKLFFTDKPKLTEDEFNTATILRLLCEAMDSSGVDSTQALLSPPGSGSSKAGWTAAQIDAHGCLEQIRSALPHWEYEIVRKVCGEAWPLKDAIFAHSICHKDGVTDAFKNALVHLKQAQAGAGISWRIIATAADYRKAMLKQFAA